MGEQKRSLREFLRHVNDYTYRFDPEKGRFRYRELRGVRDTAFDFYMWLKCWKDMIVFVAKCPVSAVRALFRYQWFSTYLTYPNFVDRGTLGMRGNQLRMARAQYDRIVKKATDLLRISGTRSLRPAGSPSPSWCRSRSSSTSAPSCPS